MARAVAAKGDRPAFEEHADLARRALEQEADPENRAHIEGRLESIPRP